MSSRWITALFLAFGTLWILVSDRVIETLTSDATRLSKLQTWKGICFVCLSAALIYVLTRRAELRRADLERKTREQRDRLAHILNVSPAIIYALSRPAGSQGAWTLDLVGENILAITGYPVQAWQTDAGMWLDGVHPDDREKVIRNQLLVVQALSMQQEFRFRCSDGSYKWINDKFIYQPGGGDEPERLIGAWLDVTERRLSEERSRLISRVFDASQEGIFITDAEARFLSVNQSFTAITGYTLQDVAGRTPSILKSERQDRLFYESMWTQILSEGRWSGEIWNRRKDGEIYPEQLSVSTIRDDTGKVVQYLGIFTETSKDKAASAQIERLANYDALTDLPTRALLADRAAVALASAARRGTPLVVMHLNLDHFGRISESMGHEAGDLVLQETARRLLKEIQAEDALCRIGGDDFVLLLPDASAHDVASISLRLMDVVSKPMLIFGQTLGVTLSIGAALFPDNGTDFTQLSKAAESAVHQAKREGRNALRVASPTMQQQIERELAITRDLRWAADREQLVLHYQPQIDMASRKIIGVEALVRWQHPKWGLMSPGVFIPIAEEAGLIQTIGNWVLREALRQTAAWAAQGLPVVPVAVNLSVVQFRNPQLNTTIAHALADTGVAPALLELELTESVAMENSDFSVAKIATLKALGVTLSIDDFGTGYSSLSYLKRFAVDKLKIDQTFVRGVTHDPQDAAIVTTVIGLAKSLNLKTIAEGVETPEQLEFLRQASCDELQGYLFYRPMPAQACEALLAGLHPLPAPADQRS